MLRVSTVAGPVRVSRDRRAGDSAGGLAEDIPAAGSGWGRFGPAAPRCPDGTGSLRKTAGGASSKRTPVLPYVPTRSCPQLSSLGHQVRVDPGDKRPNRPLEEQSHLQQSWLLRASDMQTPSSDHREQRARAFLSRVLAGARLGHTSISLYFPAHPKVRPFDGVWWGQ